MEADSLALVTCCISIFPQTFRTDIRDGLKIESAAADLVGGVPHQVIYVICSHYFIRKAGEAISLLAISTKVLRSYFTNLWTVFDILAIALTITATRLVQFLVLFITTDSVSPLHLNASLRISSLNQARWEDFRPGLDAIVLGMLWARLLGFLKVINKQMALFILSLNEILRDLIYFALVLLLVIFMFADMVRDATTG